MKNTQITDTTKLVVVTRRDLQVGYQAVQSGHAAIGFVLQYLDIAKDWHTISNYLAFLTTSDEEALEELVRKAEQRGIKHSLFFEPDIDNQLTAVAFEPSDLTRRLTSNCSLLGKGWIKQEDLIKE